MVLGGPTKLSTSNRRVRDLHNHCSFVGHAPFLHFHSVYFSSVLTLWGCFAVHSLRDSRGMVSFSLLATMFLCVQDVLFTCLEKTLLGNALSGRFETGRSIEWTPLVEKTSMLKVQDLKLKCLDSCAFNEQFVLTKWPSLPNNIPWKKHFFLREIKIKSGTGPLNI